MSINKISKPTIFLSHSSSDSDILNRIEKTINDITNSTLNLFMSSDNKSISPGINWYQSISENLNDAHLLFAFLSPRALQSQWVAFECGYANANNIPIVPVAFNGLKIEEIGPPLGSSNGINLVDADGLNRIINAINIHLQHNHQFDFKYIDFKRIILGTTTESFQPPKPGKYRVYTRDGKNERRHESVLIKIKNTHMSARTESWESVGLFVDDRFYGRFCHFKETTSSRCGIHDLAWNGKEYFGTARVDSGAWKIDELIWRPDEE